MIKKLCIFTTGFAFNRQILLDFFEEIFPNQVEIFLFVPRECRGKFKSRRIKIFESEYNKYLCFLDLRRFCRKNNIDRILSMGSLPQEGFAMALASVMTKTDFVCHLVTNPFYAAFKVKFNKAGIKSFFALLFLYPLLLFPKKFYVGASDITEICKRYFFFAKDKIDYLRMPVDTGLFSPKNKIKIRKKLKLPLKEQIVINVGRIEYAKGSDFLLEIARRNKETLFILIGQLLDRKVKEAALENIKIIPPQGRKSLADYYNSADLGLFPSRSDAGPLVARESMSCGTPVLVTDMPGPRTLEPAIKFPLKIDEIDKKLKYFFELSEKEREKISLKSRKFIVDTNSIKICKDLYIEKLLNLK